MDKALTAICLLRHLILWQSREEVLKQLYCINHLTLGSPWVDIFTMEMQTCPCRIEALILELTDWPPIHGIGEITAKVRHVKAVGPTTNFFIWTKGNSYLTMFNLRMGRQISHSRHDFSNTRLVVCP